ncbi:Mtpn [Symbiodinium natans]|uniref:Mtpn protein n=1 Tax=Symbiodinium natans TaxID=878477 RepID=A0A812Q8S5_9DINO|nr:Mtpn [Symbiodinium natans]
MCLLDPVRMMRTWVRFPSLGVAILKKYDKLIPTDGDDLHLASRDFKQILFKGVVLPVINELGPPLTVLPDLSTPLMLAVDEAHIPVAQLLLEHGALTKCKDEDGFTALARCDPGVKDEFRVLTSGHTSEPHLPEEGLRG